MMTGCVVASEARPGWLPSHIISSSFFNIRLCDGRSSGPLHFRADDVVKGSRSVRSRHDADRGRSSTVAEIEEGWVEELAPGTEIDITTHGNASMLVRSRDGPGE